MGHDAFGGWRKEEEESEEAMWKEDVRYAKTTTLLASEGGLRKRARLPY